MQQNPKLMELNATHCLMLHLMCNTVRRPVTWNGLKDSSLSRNSWSTWQWPTHVKLLRSGLRLRVARNATQGKPTNVGIAFPPYISARQLECAAAKIVRSKGGVHVGWIHPLTPSIRAYIQIGFQRLRWLSGPPLLLWSTDIYCTCLVKPQCL